MNEYQDMDSFPIGSSVKYKCRPGYRPQFSLTASVTCLKNQKWSETKEFCKSESLDTLVLWVGAWVWERNFHSGILNLCPIFARKIMCPSRRAGEWQDNYTRWHSLSFHHNFHLRRRVSVRETNKVANFFLIGLLCFLQLPNAESSW